MFIYIHYVSHWSNINLHKSYTCYIYNDLQIFSKFILKINKMLLEWQITIQCGRLHVFSVRFLVGCILFSFAVNNPPSLSSPFKISVIWRIITSMATWLSDPLGIMTSAYFLVYKNITQEWVIRPCMFTLQY